MTNWYTCLVCQWTGTDPLEEEHDTVCPKCVKETILRPSVYREDEIPHYMMVEAQRWVDAAKRIRETKREYNR